MSANPNILAADAVVTLGDRQFKIIKKAGKSFAGEVWEAHLIRNGTIDSESPFIIKYDVLYNPLFPSEVEFKRCQKEVEKQSELFESAVYWLGNKIVTLMPKLPGQPILNIQGIPTHPGLEDLTLAERLELAALVIQTYLEFHAKGLVHIDLNPGNLLIAIERINGKAYFQCNIIDFTDAKQCPLATAPENRFSSTPHQNFKSDIYLLTPIIATILGEYNVFKYKWQCMNNNNLRLESEVETAPFCLTGMQSYLSGELFKLQKAQFSKDKIDDFIRMGMKACLTKELLEWEKMNLSKERIFEIVSEARYSYLTDKLNGRVDETSGSMKSYLIKALLEAPENLLSQAEITEFIVNNSISEFLKDELFLWIDAVISMVTRMGSNSPRNRPEEIALVSLFNKAALVCREREIELKELQQGKEADESSIMPQAHRAENGIPIRNHLLIEEKLSFTNRIQQNILQKVKQIDSESSKAILFHAEKITEDDASIPSIKKIAGEARNKAIKHNQSVLSFFYKIDIAPYQNIINIVEAFERHKNIGMAVLKEIEKIDPGIAGYMRQLAHKLLAGNGSEETIQKMRGMAQAVIESAEKPGEEHIPILDYVEVYKNILTIINSSNAQSSEDASAISTQPSHYYLPMADGDTAHFRIGQK